MGEIDAGARSEKVSSADELLRVRDVQRVLDVSRTMAYKLVSDGVIASVRVGRLVRVRQLSSRRAASSSFLSGSPPSPPPSGRSVRLPLGPGEEGRGLFQELVLHLELPDALLGGAQLSGLVAGWPDRLVVEFAAPPDHPGVDRLRVQAELLAALGDGPAGGDDVVCGLPVELLGVLVGWVLSRAPCTFSRKIIDGYYPGFRIPRAPCPIKECSSLVPAACAAGAAACVGGAIALGSRRRPKRDPRGGKRWRS